MSRNVILGRNGVPLVLARRRPIPPPPPPFFESRWDGAAGTSDAILMDGGRWNMIYGTQRANVIAAVPGAPLGWTLTPNVLRVTDRGTWSAVLERTAAIPVSASHFGRFYFRDDETQTNNNHVVCYNPVGDIQVAIWNRSATFTPDGTNIRFRTYYTSAGISTAGTPFQNWGIGDGVNQLALEFGRWYRYEWHMEYVTPTTYRFWPRIYEYGGTEPIYDYRDYWGGDFGAKLSDFYDAGGTFGFSNVQLARDFGLGQEGPARSNNSGESWYHAAVALSFGDWIGGLENG